VAVPAATRSYPFLRGLHFAAREAFLARPRGASQLRDSAGLRPDFRWSHTGRGYVPGVTSLRHGPAGSQAAVIRRRD
jgi:hypothetical protein